MRRMGAQKKSHDLPPKGTSPIRACNRQLFWKKAIFVHKSFKNAEMT